MAARKKRYQGTHRGDRVRVKGRGTRIWRVLSGNANSIMVETTGDDYQVTYASRDDVTAVKDDD
jgi:hypothetical protein